MSLVSVIIPTYKGAAFLGDAINSILGQTYPHFELIIIDDASPDQTYEVVERFHDPRIKYFRCGKNLGVVEAREKGLELATGELIAFLDQDDRFHPDKLGAHVKLHEEDHAVGFSYNARFELDYSSDTIREIWRPPEKITLPDLVLGFPIAPSEIVLKRDWAVRMITHYKPCSWTGGEIVRYGGLFLDGCKFGYVDRALNYRRHHSGRLIKDLLGGCDAEIACQEMIFNDSRCPPDVVDLRPIAHSNIYAFWAYRAYKQGRFDIGQELIQKALTENHSFAVGGAGELLNLFVINSIDDENCDHELLLGSIFHNVPEALRWGEEELSWAVGRGLLIKGMRNLMWGRVEKGAAYLKDAFRRRALFDESVLLHFTKWLVDYAKEFGIKPAENVLQVWMQNLDGNICARDLRRLVSSFRANMAFEMYDQREYLNAMKCVFLSVKDNPSFAMNRGMQVVCLKALIHTVSESLLGSK